MAITSSSPISPLATLLETWGAGRVFLEVDAWSDLSSEPASAGSLAIVDAIPGAWFLGNGSAWVMHGTAEFDDATARDNELPSPAAGMTVRLATELFDRRYDGSGWRPTLQAVPIVAGSVTGTGSGHSESISDGGLITFSACNTLAIDNFLPSSDFDEVWVTFDLSAATAAGDVTVNMRTSAPATFSDGVHGWHYHDVSSTGTEGASGNAGTATSMTLARVDGPGGFGFRIIGAQLAEHTKLFSDNSRDGGFKRHASGIVKNTSTYAGIIVSLGNSSLMTGKARIRGWSNNA